MMETTGWEGGREGGGEAGRQKGREREGGRYPHLARVKANNKELVCSHKQMQYTCQRNKRFGQRQPKKR